MHALDVLREIAGIDVSDRPEVLVRGFHLAVVTLPWVHPGRLIAEMALNINVDHDEVNALASRLLVDVARDMLEAEVLLQNPGLPKLLVAHWAISGSALPSGLSADEMREPVLPWADLDALGYDLIVGAHIHQPQRLGDERLDKTPGFVVGSPQQLNHGEGGEHGCWIVDFGAGVPELSPSAGREGADSAGGPSAGADGSAPSIEFVPIPSREFVTVSGRDDEIPEGAIVRVRYTATEEEAREYDHARIRRELLEAGASRVTIEPNIIRQTRARSEKIHDQLGPVEALLAYAEAQEIGDPLRERMVQRIKEWIAA